MMYFDVNLLLKSLYLIAADAITLFLSFLGTTNVSYTNTTFVVSNTLTILNYLFEVSKHI